MILILVSFESKKDAEKTANYLIDNKLAACMELYPVKNFYFWKGKKQIADEISGIIKTEGGYYKKVKDAIKKILPYKIPQIIKLDATANKSYLNWVKKSLK